MKARIAFLMGMPRRDAFEGVGALLSALEVRFGHVFSVSEHLVGAAALNAGQEPLSDEVLAHAQQADAVWMDGFGSGGAAFSGAQLRQRLRRSLALHARVQPLRCLSRAVGVAGLDALLVSDFEPDLEGLKSVEPETSAHLARERVAHALARQRWGLVTEVTPDQGPTEIHGSVRLERRRFEAVDVALRESPGRMDVVLSETDVAERLAQSAAGLPGAVLPWTSAWLNADGRGIYWLPEGLSPAALANQMAFALRTSLRLESEAAGVVQALGFSGTGKTTSADQLRAAVAGELLGSAAI
ncbi:MAG: hypothetical protein ACKVPX_17125 [Myxococcaceae bacterium]